jgi:PAS domain S-box-containing protein
MSTETTHLALLPPVPTEVSEQLRISEMRYRRLFEAARDGILILDAVTCKITDVNPFMVELLEYSRDEFLGRELWQIGLFKDAAESQRMYQELQNTGYIRYADLPLQSRGGERREVEFICNVYDENGHQVIQCYIRDISRHKRMEAAEQETQLFLQSTLDALSSHITVIDQDGKIIAVNQAWRQFAEQNQFDGISCGVGANYLKICETARGNGEEEASAVAQGIREIINGQRLLFSLEYPCHSPEEKRWFNVRVTRFVSEGPLRVVVAHENITMRRQAEEHLRQNEADLAEAQRLAHLGSWAWNPITNTMTWSDEMYRITGMDRQGLATTFEAALALTHPDDQQELDTLVQRACNEGEPYSLEHRFVRSDGTVRIGHSRADVTMDEAGHVIRIFGTFQDITERKQAEEKLRRSEERYRALALATPELVWTSDTDGINGDMAEWLKFTGQSQLEAQGRGWAQAIHPDDRARIDQIWARSVEDKTPYKTEFRLCAKDGSYRLFAVHGVPVIDSGGNIREWVGTCTDIHDQRAAETALRESEARFSSAFEHAPIGMALVDLNGRCLKVNQSLCNMLGYSAEELCHHTFQEITYPDDLDKDLENARRLLANEISSYAMEKRYFHKQGHLIWGLLAGSLVRDEDDQPLYFIGQLKDITESKLTEKSLIESQQRLSLATRSAHIGIWDWDVKTNAVVWDARMYELQGLPKQEHDGAESWRMGIHPEDRDRMNAEIAAVLNEGEGFHSEYRIVWPNGEVRHIEVHATVQRAGDGTAQRMVGVNWDITERKQSAENLHRTVAQLDKAQQLVHLGSWEWNPVTNVVVWSDQLYRIFGLDSAEFGATYEAYLERVHPEDKALVKESIETALRDHQPWEYSVRIIRPDGTVRVLHKHGSVTVDDAGSVVHLMGTAHDVTERELAQAEQAYLRSQAEEQRQRLDTIMATVPGVVWEMWVQPDGVTTKTVFVNSYAETMLGYSTDDWLSVPDFWLSVAHPDDKEQAAREMMAMFTSGQGGSLQFRWITKDEHVLWVESRLVVLCGEAGCPLGMRGVTTDITEHKLADERRAELLLIEQAARVEAEKATQRISRLQSVTSALVEVHTPEEVAEVLVKQGVEALGASAGSVVFLTESGEELEMVRMIGYPEETAQNWQRFPLMAQVPLAEAVRTGEAVWLETRDMTIRRYPALAEVITAPSDCSWAALPLLVGGKAVGALGLRFPTLREFNTNDREFILTLVYHCAQVLERTRLAREVQSGREQLQVLSRQLMEGQERERRHLSRELHDELGQALTGLKFDLAWLNRRLFAMSDDELTDPLLQKTSAMSLYIDETIHSVRRIAARLRPALLDDLGLAAALEWQLEEFEMRTGITCYFGSREVQIDLDQERATALLRIFQEALTNVARHAQATRVDVKLERQENGTSLTVTDNGRGIMPKEYVNAKTLGLLGMRERAQLIAGALKITGAAGSGTTVTVWVPLQDRRSEGRQHEQTP